MPPAKLDLLVWCQRHHIYFAAEQLDIERQIPPFHPISTSIATLVCGGSVSQSGGHTFLSRRIDATR